MLLFEDLVNQGASLEDSMAGLKKLAYGEVDGFIDNFVVANYFMENSLISNLKVAFEIKNNRFKYLPFQS